MSSTPYDPRPAITETSFDALLRTSMGISDFLERTLANNPAALARVRENNRAEATFAAVSSWAVWPPMVRGTPGVRARSHDLAHLRNFAATGGALRAGVALVAFNKGLTTLTDVNGVNSEAERPWTTFHSGSNDHKLASALQDAAAQLARTNEPDLITGSYITDFYKGLPTRDLTEFAEFVDILTPGEFAAINAEMARLLRVEFSFLGGDVVAISIGDDPRELIAEHAPDVRVAQSRLMHYAYRTPRHHEKYLTQVLTLNRELATLLHT